MSAGLSFFLEALEENLSPGLFQPLEAICRGSPPLLSPSKPAMTDLVLLILPSFWFPRPLLKNYPRDHTGPTCVTQDALLILSLVDLQMIPSATQFPLLCDIPRSQVSGIRTLASLRGHYSAFQHLPIFYSASLSKLNWKPTD